MKCHKSDKILLSLCIHHIPIFWHNLAYVHLKDGSKNITIQNRLLAIPCHAYIVLKTSGMKTSHQPGDQTSLHSYGITHIIILFMYSLFNNSMYTGNPINNQLTKHDPKI